ncbi:hypothetical protein BJ912DRAFT_1043284 [Pholiota molesta]|nr:hypothetical protein BJ912DRAFT_1043284 [Pholiota molesta]
MFGWIPRTQKRQFFELYIMQAGLNVVEAQWRFSAHNCTASSCNLLSGTLRDCGINSTYLQKRKVRPNAVPHALITMRSRTSGGSHKVKGHKGGRCTQKVQTFLKVKKSVSFPASHIRTLTYGIGWPTFLRTATFLRLLLLPLARSNGTSKKGASCGQPSLRPFYTSFPLLSAFVLIFCLTAADLGLVSYQIHKYGRYAQNYASLEYRNSLGLCLCACLISLMLCLGHYWISIGLTTFISLICAVFFGTVAGIIRTTTPFRGTSCDRPQDAYPEKWRPYYKECARVVAMEGVSWSLWALYLILMVGSLLYMFRITPRPTPGRYYWSPTHTTPSSV